MKKLSSLLQNTPSDKHELTITLTLQKNSHEELIDDLATYTDLPLTLTLILKAQSSLTLTGLLTSTHSQLKRIITVILQEKGAHAALFYSGIGDKNQTITITTTQHHQAENSSSNVTVKTVLKKNAKLICKSLIRVEKNAELVQAKQVTKNLLLSPQAHAAASPKLEVLSHNVKCSHGAAISHINHELLFFLQSRGFSTQNSQGLLIKAFLQML